MSAPHQQAIDVAQGAGISTQLADAARNGILAGTIPQEEGRPVTFVDHQVETRAASNEFLQRGDKAKIAQILRIPAADAQKRFKGSRPGIFNTPSCTVRPGRTDFAYTILALGDLSYENGLPALGSSRTKYSLRSGEALHFMGDLEQTYGETGRGTLIWFYWSNLP